MTEGMQVYLINGQGQSGMVRLAHSIKQLQTVGLSDYITRIEACDSACARSMRHKLATRDLCEYIERFRKESHTRVDHRIPMTWSTVAHAASHDKAWSAVQQSTCPAIKLVLGCDSGAIPHKVQQAISLSCR